MEIVKKQAYVSPMVTVKKVETKAQILAGSLPDERMIHMTQTDAVLVDDFTKDTAFGNDGAFTVEF